MPLEQTTTMDDDQELIDAFHAGIVLELFATCDRELRACPDDRDQALCSAFEELHRRIDWMNQTVVASITAQISVPRESMNATLVAMAFGNYLATRGIFLNEKIRGDADH